MTSVEIQSAIIKILAEKLRIDESKITAQSHFINDLGLDSLDQVELMMGMEEKFNCHIPDEDANKLATVSDAVQYIEKQQLAEKLVSSSQKS